MEKPLLKPEMLHCCNKNLVSLLILFSISFGVNAQIKLRKDKRVLFKANKTFDNGDYTHSLNLYESIYSLDSMNAELNYKIGVCKFENKKTRMQAKKYFARTSADSYLETDYYMGKLLHAENKFEIAIDYFHSYLKRKGDKDHTVKEIEDLVEKCYYARIQTEQIRNNDIVISNLGDHLNSEYAEYAPLIPADENAIYFTSRRKNTIWNKVDVLENYYEDIYVSYRNPDSTWQSPVMLDTSINSPYHDAACGLSADGEKLLIYQTSEDHVHGHIYISEFINSKWNKPHKLDANINSAHHNETSACFSPDAEMIFFSSDRLGGFGGKDLYSIKKAPSGKWAKPMNLGPKINTEYNEDAPFIHPHDSVLFFSSEGHQNMGGYDIFKSSFDEAEHFTSPKNMGYPINTTDDDIFFVLNASGSKGYMSSKRKDSYGLYDLYSVNFSINNAPMSVYNIHLFDEATNTIINKVEITVTNIERKIVDGIYKSNPLSGKTIIISKPGREYRIAIQANGYEPLIIDNYILNNETELSFKLVKKQHG